MYKSSRRMLQIAYGSLLTVCLMVASMIGPPAFAVIVSVAFYHLVWKRRGQVFTAHGTAKWASASEMRRAGMLSASTGLILGRVHDRGGWWSLFDKRIGDKEACERATKGRKCPDPIVRLPNAVHTAVFAPTSVGKGVSCIIPFLLDCQESCVVLDLKGEIYQATAAHRERMGHRIVALDPFRNVTQTPDSLNPLAFINPNSDQALDECRDLAESLVIRTGEEKEEHWNSSAEAWIGAMMAATVCHAKPEDRSLQTVRAVLTNPANIEGCIQVMTGSQAWQGMLARLGHQLKQFESKELSSVLTTTNRHMRFLDTISVAESTRSSSFDPNDICKKPTTVYLVLSPEHMRAQSGLLRMWIASMLRACVRNGLQEKRKVHFVLDEAASLGHMPALADMLDKYRGFGARGQFYYQDRGQLQKCWPNGADQTLLSNTTQVYFGVNDNATAKEVSDRLGDWTQVIRSWGSSHGTSNSNSSRDATRSYSTNKNENFQLAARKLLKPEEVINLSPRDAVCFTPGMPPIRTRLIRYYEEKPVDEERELSRTKFAAVANMILLTSIVGVFGFAFLRMNHGQRTRAAREQHAEHGRAQGRDANADRWDAFWADGYRGSFAGPERGEVLRGGGSGGNANVGPRQGRNGPSPVQRTLGVRDVRGLTKGVEDGKELQ
jgi:type IV secretion system protein VirD4